MKASTKFLALLAALAAGSASAAGVTAGTSIKNVAVASFDDPNGGGLTSSSSQEVITTVLANPSFDIFYYNNTNDKTTAGGTLPTNYELSVKNGDEMQSAYTVSNAGNVNNYVVSLTADTTGTTAGSNPRPATNVKYFVDANGDGILQASERGASDALAVVQVTLPVDDITTNTDEGKVSIIQVITVPAGANPGEQYAVSPRGTGDTYVDNNGNPTNTPSGNTVQEATSDLQFARAVVYTPTVSTTPPVTNPPTPTPNPPLPPITPVPTPVYPDPNDPTPGNPKTYIGVIGDDQYAYPKADIDSTNEKVTFLNEVKNSGTIDDTVNLFPTNAGTINNNDGTFTIPVTLPNGTAGTATVRFLKADGSGLLPVVNNWPTLTVAANGGAANYRVEITYPDYDAVADSNPGPITVTIGVDSGNDAGTTADDTTNDVIYPSQLQFGDSTPALGAVSTPTPTEAVVVAASTGTSPNTTTDRTAMFLMDVANTGEYADTFKLNGSVSVPVSTSATASTVEVKYYLDNNGALGTQLTYDAVNKIYTTGTVAANTELKVWAVIDLPADALATSSNGSSNPLAVSQNVTSVYSGINRTDNNDLITITAVPTDPNTPTTPPASGVLVTKTVDKAAAKPGDNLQYTILAKNNFNASLKNFMVTESNSNTNGSGGTTNVFTWTTFQSVSATYSGSYVTGTVMYRFNSGAWSTSNAAPANVTRVDVAVDTNGDSNITAADTMAAGGQISVSMTVKVK